MASISRSKPRKVGSWWIATGKSGKLSQITLGSSSWMYWVPSAQAGGVGVAVGTAVGVAVGRGVGVEVGTAVG